MNLHKPLDVFGLIADSILNYAIDHYGEYNDSIAFYNAWLLSEAQREGFPMGETEALDFALKIISSCISAPLELLLIDRETERMFDSVQLGKEIYRKERGLPQ